MLLHKIEDGQ